MGLRKLLQAQLARVTRSWGVEMDQILLRNYNSCGISQRNFLEEQRLKTCTSYQWAVALQLAPQWGIAPEEIAEKLVLDLQNSQAVDFEAKVMAKGIIKLAVSDRTLADWLENQTLQPSPHQEISPAAIDYFPIQAAHARCCSLLKLGSREKIIQLQHQMPEPWQISQPSEISWLDTSQNLRLITPSERHLVNLLVNLGDEFEAFERQNQPHKWLKLATGISKSFAKFDKDCRIFGETRINNLALAQARLGLVAVTKKGLQKLLEEYLGAIAPSEL